MSITTDDIFHQVGTNKGAFLAQIEMCNIKLKQLNLPKLPDEYVELLKKSNGLTHDDIRVFGVDIKDNNWFDDIFSYNTQTAKLQSLKWIILGRDNEMFLIYDEIRNMYHVVDQDDFSIDVSSNSLVEILVYFLHLDLDFEN